MLTMSALRSSTAGLRSVSGPRALSVRPVRLGGAATPSAASSSAAVSGRRRSSAVVVRASAGAEEPETAKEAIELGNSLAKAAKWQEALAVYEKALTLPGTGLKRYRDKPRLISDGERSAALFNIACCQAQLGDVRAGLVALAGCLELGYDDFAQLRTDPDLTPLRADERFEGLLKRFEKPAGGFFSTLFSGRK